MNLLTILQFHNKKSTHKKIVFRGALILQCFSLFCGPDIAITKDDLYIEQKSDDGFHLYVRKKPDIGSVLLVETTSDPDKKLSSYAFRAEKYNPINGDEKRIQEGKILDKTSWLGGRYSIIDSTPEPNDKLTLAFHLFIPTIVVYGDPSEERFGREQVTDGTFINIRSFEKQFADYSGQFQDNPFRVQVTQREIARPVTEKETEKEKPNYMPKAMEEYEEIAKEGGGKFILAGKEDLINLIGSMLDDVTGKTLDLALTIDSTRSMIDDIPLVKKDLVPLLKEKTKRFEDFRIGIVLYRDYLDDYVVKDFPFERDLDSIQKKIDSIVVDQGRDVPEAVHEAIYEAQTAFTWESEARLIILVGDAPPHPLPRGKITREMVYAKAEELGIKINAIILPQ